ncbi:LpxI family protein [Palleronia sediminis]|uniref:LpxI family protein n=1 Tax=Palleronia sediminis TaxID=2547833 RepID=A0A4R6AI14_9RHOB|nr:UDP-2,3-diacylglucosamine diphosphatase LpxI [Palleronia sediminis]TDL83560.1 LpxI family protein [Palleronia sediminis]
MSLALIAGQGRLPALVVAAARPARVLAMEGSAPDTVAPDTVFPLERLGSVLAGLKADGISRICLAGAVRRPGFDPARLDVATRPLVPRLTDAMVQGDDAALRALMAIFEDAGLTPVAAQDLVPDLCPPPGPLGACAPDDSARSDIARGLDALSIMGAADVGQGCVVARGQVLAVEALPGTDWMLRSMAALRGPGDLACPAPAGGVLVKAAKPGQDRRADLPAIGPETVELAAAAGLCGIAVEAGGVMVLDPPELIRAADAAGLFVVVVA